METLSQLEVLDGLDREGRVAVVHEILADVPGLDQYLQYLVSSGSSVSTLNTVFSSFFLGLNCLFGFLGLVFERQGNHMRFVLQLFRFTGVAH